MLKTLQSQKTQKLLAVIIVIFLLVAIPLTVWFGALQQQNTQQNASTKVWNGGTDTCGRVHVAFENESPSCPGGAAVTNTYTTTVRLTSVDGKSHSVTYLFQSFWCKDSSELGDGVNPTSCIKRIADHSKNATISVRPGSGVTVTSIQQKASSYGFGGSCGVFQTDFSYTVDGTSCRFGYSALDPSPSHPVLAAGYCNTGRVCVATTPTPTPTPTPPLTPTSTPTPTPTPTPTEHKECRQNACVLVPGGGSDLCSSDTDCQVTPTPTTPVTPTPTGTPAPTSTPAPTALVTPKPTLPPTGPGNTILSVGLFGALVAVVGTVIVLAL